MENGNDVIRSYYEKVWNERNVEKIKELVTEDYKRHISPSLPPLDVDGQTERIRQIQMAFPDIVNLPVDVVRDGNIVFVRLDTHCTHLGTFMDMDATGHTIHNSALEEFLLRDNKIAEHWGGPDVMDIRRQIKSKNQEP